MPWPERTVACPECKAERTTRAGTGTRLSCAKCGAKFPAPAPQAEPPPAGGQTSRVKRAKATSTVVRKNARPRPKKAPAAETPPAGPAQPAAPVGAQAGGPAAGDDPAGPPPQDPPEEPSPLERQRRAGRRGGLAYYRELMTRKKAS